MPRAICGCLEGLEVNCQSPWSRFECSLESCTGAGAPRARQITIEDRRRRTWACAQRDVRAVAGGCAAKIARPTTSMHDVPQFAELQPCLGVGGVS